jgi:hypothetical protein
MEMLGAVRGGKRGVCANWSGRSVGPTRYLPAGLGAAQRPWQCTRVELKFVLNQNPQNGGNENSYIDYKKEKRFCTSRFNNREIKEWELHRQFVFFCGNEKFGQWGKFYRGFIAIETNLTDSKLTCWTSDKIQLLPFQWTLNGTFAFQEKGNSDGVLSTKIKTSFELSKSRWILRVIRKQQ